MKSSYDFTDELQQKIRKNIRGNASLRHVPTKIIEAPVIPYALNMKKVEFAVQEVIHGQEMKNKNALEKPQNPGVLADIKELNF